MLFSSLGDPDWPDLVDYYYGMVTYFGDNKKAGDLHETPQRGNQLLRDWFDALHQGELKKIPPIFFFTKGMAGKDVLFRAC